MRKRLQAVSDRVLHVQANIVLGVVYVVIVPFVWIMHRLYTPKIRTGWRPWNITASTIEECTSE